MRAAVYYNNKDIRIEESPVPAAGAGEVVVKVRASGICGSDLMEWYRIDKAPLVLGHEIAGEIVERGKGVKRFQEGDRVTAAHHVPCNICRYCLRGHHTVCGMMRETNFYPGGFSEFVRIPAVNVRRGLFKISGNISYAEASFTEPAACVLRGLRAARFRQGMSVLVIGAGIAGILFVHIARALGAGVIKAVDITPFRLSAAKRFGADEVMDPSSNPGMSDIVIVCTGAEGALKQAAASVDKGGVILFFAPTFPGAVLPVSINDVFFRRDVTFTTSYAGSPADYADALSMISMGRINVKEMITHRLPLDDISEGFALVAGAKKSLKVIIEPFGS